MDSVDAAVDRYTLQKISLLRSFSLKTGIQILLREYQFDNKHRQTFVEEDIINIFPLVKHINPRVSFGLQRSSCVKMSRRFIVGFSGFSICVGYRCLSFLHDWTDKDSARLFEGRL